VIIAPFKVTDFAKTVCDFLLVNCILCRTVSKVSLSVVIFSLLTGIPLLHPFLVIFVNISIDHIMLPKTRTD